jgi:hypothetical protein
MKKKEMFDHYFIEEMRENFLDDAELKMLVLFSISVTNHSSTILFSVYTSSINDLISLNMNTYQPIPKQPIRHYLSEFVC